MDAIEHVGHGFVGSGLVGQAVDPFSILGEVWELEGLGVRSQ